MAGPGGGPPRKSHTKSRKGCKTCKRRHIRCDENFPQCRNCTKHNCRCDYMDAPIPGDDRPKTPQGADLLWTPEAQEQIELWRRTGEFPFPDLQIYPQPAVHSYSTTDLRLIHHVTSTCREMQHGDSGKFTVWTNKVPIFLRIASSYPFVMHALLGFSASHLGWLTENSTTQSVAFHHKSVALKGLQDAIASFSRTNADAVLAASILLSWQSMEWRSWSSLMQSASTVIDAMQPFKYESIFSDFMDEQATFPRAQSSPPADSRRKEPRPEDLATLQHVYRSLQRVEVFVSTKSDELRGLRELMSFIRNLRAYLPVRATADQFDLLHTLRAWLFWLPISFLQRAKRDPSVMLVLAHFYAVALAIVPLFPASGAAYFGSMSVAPIEEIMRSLTRMSSSSPLNGVDVSEPVRLMEFPLEMVSKFRVRMGWSQGPEPQFSAMPRSPYDVANLGFNSPTTYSDFSGHLTTPYSNENVSLSPSVSPLYAPAAVTTPVYGRPSHILQAPLLTSTDGFDPNAYSGYTLLGNSPSSGYVEEPYEIEHENPSLGYSGGFVAPTALWA